MIKTVILCGGQGTRIRGVAGDLPKPMIPIGSHPILWHIMNIYSAAGLRDFVLCLGHQGSTIKEFFLNYRALNQDVELDLATGDMRFPDPRSLDWRVTLAETGEATQTAGRLAKVQRYLADCELVCVTYGDGVADLDPRKIIAFHREHGRLATVTGVRPPGRFGVMRTTREGSKAVVRHFAEKPQTEEGWINGGFFVFSPRVWEYFGDDPSLILEREPLARLAEAGELIMYEHSGFWQPMDTYREWKLLNDMWDRGDAPWKR